MAFMKPSEKEDDKKNPFNPWMFLAIILVALGMMAVFIIGMLNSSIAIALGGFGGGAAIIMILMFIMVFKPSKNKGTANKYEIIKKGANEKLKMEEKLSTSTQSEQIDWYKTKNLLYTGKIAQNNKNCPVCKMPIKNDETFVMQCPQCYSLFHGEHLVEWILEHTRCPVCAFKIDIKK